jgi:dTDP-glucose 4,6-dehydratase
MTNPLARDLDHVLTHTEPLWADARGSRFFLTGGTGFVGTWLTESLLWANRRLGLGLSAVLLTRNPAAFQARSPRLAEDPAVTLQPGDAASYPFPEGTFRFVIHAATERYVPPDRDRPVSTFDADIAATRHALEFAGAHGATRFLFTSSGAVYGKQPPEIARIPEEYPGAPSPADAGSAYGQGKRISEFFCSGYASVYGFDALLARLFAFVGPYLPLDANYAVGNFIRDALAGGPVRIEGDGAPCRSYLYAADLAIWLWTILFRGAAGRPYNVGSPEAISIADLAGRVVAVAAPGAEIRIARQAEPGSPAPRYVPATERAERELGLRPWISIEEGVRRTCEWRIRTATTAQEALPIATSAAYRGDSRAGVENPVTTSCAPGRE